MHELSITYTGKYIYLVHAIYRYTSSTCIFFLNYTWPMHTFFSTLLNDLKLSILFLITEALAFIWDI